MRMSTEANRKTRALPISFVRIHCHVFGQILDLRPIDKRSVSAFAVPAATATLAASIGGCPHDRPTAYAPAKASPLPMGFTRRIDGGARRQVSSGVANSTPAAPAVTKMRCQEPLID